MKINEIAERLDMTPRAIRLYEARGLLKPEREAENGYRSFAESDAWRLQTIGALRGAGLGLGAVKALLDKLDQGDSATVHHYLELQRMALASKWVEGKYAMTMLDELIGRFEDKGRLDAADLFELTGRLRTIRRQQETWIDAWQFDDIAPQFDRSAALLSTGTALTQDEYDHVLDLIAQWISPRPGEQGLDIGTGTGNLAGLLASQGTRMSAVDQSKEMLAICRDKHPGVAAKLGNALALPFVDERFALVVSAFALHFLNGDQQTLAVEEMNRVLAPNGRICLAGLMTDGHEDGEEAAPAAAGDAVGREHVSERHAIDRGRLMAWFKAHDYITVHYAVNPQIGVLYAVRKH
ncbi:methyltransferase domain-containing protein [Paenibacillus lycopersici]|uniref:Methyltransferase domain-containing protein n=1 Tax=Paenibacillus lycopersici TaxID=2704462 RepID=A0A6C0G4R6_9BACL|nr:methyltransferase domain-containing protein [Paenibacillus lycopersici]QHT61840.1 methyltransferase domain-containing protein [Paenibacillus lycopersici]